MFGQNERAGRKFFEASTAAEPGRLLVTSIFVTLQGEGPYSGRASVFVRLAKCNLTCSFCDTYFDSGTWFTYDELLTEIDKKIFDFFDGKVPLWAQFEGSTTDKAMQQNFFEAAESVLSSIADGRMTLFAKPRNFVLVITGGEPSLQTNLYDFLKIAAPMFEHTQIESNGIFVPPVPSSTTVVLSPKCLEKDGKAVRYTATNLDALERADALKFVMNADPESPYSSVPDWVHEWRWRTNKPVFVSPMNYYLKEPQKAKELRAAKQAEDISLDERSLVDEVISFWEPGLLDMKTNQINHEYTAKYAIMHGFTFNLQAHLFASVA